MRSVIDAANPKGIAAIVDQQFEIGKQILAHGLVPIIEPEVTIIRRQDRTVEEYRINGELYMIKVTPTKGVPYYLMDTDGDGSLETQRNDLDPNILVPSWVIFRW